jgi:hypothetical protein
MASLNDVWKVGVGTWASGSTGSLSESEARVHGFGATAGITGPGGGFAFPIFSICAKDKADGVTPPSSEPIGDPTPWSVEQEITIAKM